MTVMTLLTPPDTSSCNLCCSVLLCLNSKKSLPTLCTNNRTILCVLIVCCILDLERRRLLLQRERSTVHVIGPVDLPRSFPRTGCSPFTPTTDFEASRRASRRTAVHHLTLYTFTIRATGSYSASFAPSHSIPCSNHGYDPSVRPAEISYQVPKGHMPPRSKHPFSHPFQLKM